MTRRRRMGPWRDERGRFVSKAVVDKMRRDPRAVRTVIVPTDEGHVTYVQYLGEL